MINSKLFFMAVVTIFAHITLPTASMYWEPYPDFSCHDEYIPDMLMEENNENGKEFLLGSMEICSGIGADLDFVPDKCFKRCVYEQLRVLKRGKLELENEENISELLNHKIFPNHPEKASQVTKQILEECASPSEELANSPSPDSCEEQEALYSCFEKAVACPHDEFETKKMKVKSCTAKKMSFYSAQYGSR